MNIPNQKDIAFFAVWVSRREDGSLTTSRLDLEQEELSKEIIQKLALGLRELADQISRE
jgi:hypothetical protein